MRGNLLEPDAVLEVITNDENIGFCIECGAERECCEPDARKYQCEECGECAVYGAQEILIMGLI